MSIKKPQLEELIRLEEEQKKDTARHIPYHIVEHIPIGKKKAFAKLNKLKEKKKYPNIREMFILHVAGMSTQKIANIFNHDKKTIRYLLVACKKIYPRI